MSIHSPGNGRSPAFDLQARAALAVRGLTHLVDADRDGLMYFLASWRAKPPRADHGLWDCGDGSGRHVDALTLARCMTPAIARPNSGELQIEGWMMRLLGPGGLTWLPREPWAQPWGADMLLREWRGDEALAEISWAQRGTMLGLTARFQATQDERYLAAGQRLIDGMLRIAERHPDGLFFPEGYYRLSGWGFRLPELHPGIAEYNAAVLVPCVRFYAAAGYAPALQLAEGLARFALRHTTGYRPDGRLRGERGNGMEDHFHTRSNFILGVLELGLIAGRPEYVAWARQSYEFAKEWGTDFGWFPEGLGCRHGEICCTTDMIEIAINLGLHVDRAYFADAERFGRNHLLESQYLSFEQLRDATAKLPAETSPAPLDGRFSTTTGVTESQVGAFAARSTLNDALHLDAAAMMQCCNAAGARGLYDLWRYAVELDENRERRPARHTIHMRFSVETPALRVISHEPARGQLDIDIKQDAALAVRLPQGETRARVLDRTNASTVIIDATGGYIEFGARAGSTVEVHYGLAEHTASYSVGSPDRSLECAGYWRGETLLRVEPPGPYLALYQRATDLPPAQPALPAGQQVDSIARRAC